MEPRIARLFAPATEAADHMQRSQGCQTPVQDLSSVINNANNSSAAACRITRQRISWFERAGLPPRTKPKRPANSTPRVANISRATRTARKVFTRLM